MANQDPVTIFYFKKVAIKIYLPLAMTKCQKLLSAVMFLSLLGMGTYLSSNKELKSKSVEYVSHHFLKRTIDVLVRVSVRRYLVDFVPQNCRFVHFIQDNPLQGVALHSVLSTCITVSGVPFALVDLAAAWVCAGFVLHVVLCKNCSIYVRVEKKGRYFLLYR